MKRLEFEKTTDHLFADNDNAMVKIALVVARSCRKITKDTNIVNMSTIHKFPQFKREELVLGSLIGCGAYSDVYGIDEINIDDAIGNEEAKYRLAKNCDIFSHNRGNNSESVNDRRLSIADDCCRQKKGEPRYVIKCLKKKLFSRDADSFKFAAEDLATEILFLSSLDHPNIIKIRGISSLGLSGFVHNGGTGFFFIMDRLHETLDCRIKEWASNDSTKSGILQKLIGRRHHGRHQGHTGSMLALRLGVAQDIAKAMDYLHDRNIIYRDLKPKNIGFDVATGTVKLFNFGFARELCLRRKAADGKYMLSGQTGSMKYMAPEVAMCDNYNLSADVYSFGILLWEICALKEPFESIRCIKKHFRRVHVDGERPSIKVKRWSTILVGLMTRCWAEETDNRPTFGEILEIMKSNLLSKPPEQVCSKLLMPSIKMPSKSVNSKKRHVQSAHAA